MKLVTFETPDGRKVCRAHAPLRSACLRHGASMSQSCRVMQFGRWGVQGIVGV